MVTITCTSSKLSQLNKIKALKPNAVCVTFSCFASAFYIWGAI